MNEDMVHRLFPNFSQIASFKQGLPDPDEFVNCPRQKKAHSERNPGAPHPISKKLRRVFCSSD